ncbi:HET domain-containing protein [Podospora australis]|uniref:HET domain-containing protein n=1 Tax=Podospora australis TaxID=1536484 RepID=A0AAN6WVW4_9PEZI|nr:HET domain-containing protein [Podospora australis]
MRLIDALTLKLETFIGDDVPAYAILSHTWGSHEVTLQDFRTETLHQGSGYREVLEACRIARTEGYFYVWVDTCCIDKTSSAELCEAINSMFSRYRDSAVCYVYLSDLQPENDLSTALGTCRWFTRGWTPQELIAPANICFYDSSWSAIGTKRNLIAHLCYITGISKEVLRSSDSDDLYCIPVATRLSWASRRTTTRREDIASCLLGIFNVNIPLLYGEGEKAFRQLQEEILRKTSDLSILIWSPPPESSTQPLRGIWARHPQEHSPCLAPVIPEGTYSSEWRCMELYEPHFDDWLEIASRLGSGASRLSVR